jgi:xanthine dehydrogenase FAD-binding subunit
MFDLKEYRKAESVDHAIEMLAAMPGSRPIAGGTDILIKLREGKPGYDQLVDIHGLEELRYIREDEDGNILIGSGAHFTDIIESGLLKSRITMLCDAAQSVGGPQIRNVATLGGNICNGVTSADSAMGLFCLNAVLQLKGVDGARELAIQDFYLGPGKVDLRAGDVLVGFKITPENYRGYHGFYHKYAMRDAMDIATIGCGVSLKAEDGKLLDYRLAYGVAGPVPVRCPQTERAAVGQLISPELLELIGQTVGSDVKPRTSWRATREFRMNIIEELARRSTRKALQRAGEELND